MVMMGEGSAWPAMSPPCSLWFLGGDSTIPRRRPAFKTASSCHFRSGSSIIGPGNGPTTLGRSKASFYWSLFAGALILGLSVFGFVGLLGRPAVPWDALERATGVATDLLPEAIVRADGFEVRDPDPDLEFIAARHRIGDPIEFVVIKDGRELAVTAPLVPFFGRRSTPIFFLLTGVFGFLIGFGVFILRAEDRRARLFFWLCLAFSSAVMISGGWYGVQGRALHLVPGVLFFFAYTLTPVFLLKFVLAFTARDRLPGGPLLGSWRSSLAASSAWSSSPRSSSPRSSSSA